MNNKTRKIFLHGSLATKFGSQPFLLSAESPSLLLLALRSVLPGWRQHLQVQPELVFITSGVDKSNPRPIENAFIDGMFGDAEEVHILHHQEGAGLEFAVLFGITNPIAAFVVNTIGSMVISTVLGAVFQALAPSPSTGAGSSNSVTKNESFIYNGAVNVQEQGGPVPLVYGYFMCGSTVVSSSVDVEQISLGVTTPPGGETSQPEQPETLPTQWKGLSSSRQPNDPNPTFYS